jgi:predicted  nucleic acid-binding Zn-ribbon protein
VSERQVRAWVCDLCGHVWIAGKGGAPEKCAKCRKRGWNKNRPKDRPAQSRRQAKPLVQQVLPTHGVADNSPVDYKMRAAGEEEGESFSVEIATRETLGAMLKRAGEEFDVREEQEFFARTAEATLSSPPVVEVKVDDVVVPLVAPADDGSKERFAAAVDRLAKPHPKIGEKCPHGWSSWFLCPKCNSKVNA